MMKLLFSALAVTALALAFAALVRSAPIPESERLAREKLAALKDKLPDMLQALKKRVRKEEYTPVAVGPRRLGLTEAKLTVEFRYADKAGKRYPEDDYFLTVFLRYHDGAWLTSGMHASWPPTGPVWGEQQTRAAHFFLQDIDAATGE
jgi:hypothetical protein